MTTFNFHVEDNNFEVQINSPEHQYTYRKNDEIIFNKQSFIVNRIEFHVSENKVEQIVECVLI